MPSGRCARGFGRICSCGSARKRPPKDATPRIALLLKSFSNPYFLEMEQGARRAQAESNAGLFVRSVGSEAAIDQQIQFIEQIVSNRTADAIVLIPTDSERLAPSVAMAHNAGIPVIVADTPLDADALTRQGVRAPPFVGIDNAKAAYQAARALASAIPAGSEVALLEGNSNALNTRQRALGARQAFVDAGMKLVASKNTWSPDEVYEVTGILLREHPRIQAIYCISDVIAIGAMKYLADRNIAHIKLAGFDGIPEARKALEQGQMVATVDQQPMEQGYKSVKAAIDLLAGKAIPQRVEIDTVLLIQANGE
ncbi:substrate-binding domain-containing protein [Thauera butanivorans]|uniref:substrate-binding domain-containing protein n=1 Tax=Thauera butanivorans TaxID=86174 RepID=UPI003AB41D47